MSLHAARSAVSLQPLLFVATGHGSASQVHPAVRVSFGQRCPAVGKQRPLVRRDVQANASEFERRVNDTGRQAETAARETSGKLESGSQQAANRAGQAAQQQYGDPTEQAKFVAEFSATALFTFLTATATAAATASASNPLIWRMAAYGAIFPLIISIFAPVSKAHFNPMVTVSMVVAGQQSLANGINYIIAQCLGAIAGAALALWSLPGAQQTATALGAAAVPAGRSIQQAFLGEALGGIVFIYVLFATIVDPRGWGKLGPLSLGLTVPLLMWAVGPISSLSINPARAFGTAVVTGVWQHHWLFWVAPIIGGALASWIYSTFFAPTAASA